MVIIKALMDQGDANSTHGRVILAMLIVQDLFVVAMMIVLDFLQSPSEHLIIGIIAASGKAIDFVAATVILGTRVVPRLLWLAAQTRSEELFSLAVVTIVMGTALTGHHFGLSPALGAFLAGLMVGETEFNHRIVSQSVPFRDVFVSLFFVSVGMMIDPRFVASNAIILLILAVAMVLLKFLTSTAVVLPFGYTGRTAVAVGLGMTQIGEFSFMLAKQGMDAGALSETQYTLVLGAAVVTIILTPLALEQTTLVDSALARVPGMRRWFGPHIEPLIFEDTAPLKNHVIVLGHGRVGRASPRSSCVTEFPCSSSSVTTT